MRVYPARPAGTTEVASCQKKGYKLPRHIMANGDLARLVNSDEVQSVVGPQKASRARAALKKNPLRNLGALLKVNPHAKAARRAELLKSAKGKVAKKAAPRVSTKAHGKAHLAKMVAVHDYEGADYDVFSAWLGTSQ